VAENDEAILSIPYSGHVTIDKGSAEAVIRDSSERRLVANFSTSTTFAWKLIHSHGVKMV
jgi:hypothetical protein